MLSVPLAAQSPLMATRQEITEARQEEPKKRFKDSRKGLGTDAVEEFNESKVPTRGCWTDSSFSHSRKLSTLRHAFKLSGELCPLGPKPSGKSQNYIKCHLPPCHTFGCQTYTAVAQRTTSKYCIIVNIVL